MIDGKMVTIHNENIVVPADRDEIIVEIESDGIYSEIRFIKRGN